MQDKMVHTTTTQYTQYKVVHATTVLELTTAVNELMAEGWQPIGGVQPTVSERASMMKVVIDFYQSMAK